MLTYPLYTLTTICFQDDESNEKNLFCFLQQDLEITTEKLSFLLQSEIEVLADSKDKVFKAIALTSYSLAYAIVMLFQVLNLASVAARSRSKLLKGVEDGLGST